MRSITTLDLQYAHRFYGFRGEAQYLHGHTGVLTIEVEDTVNPGVNMVFPCNEIQKTAWEVLKNVETAAVFEKSEVKVWECRNCGHIVVGTKAPQVCPVCAHPQSYFEVHAENY